MIVGRFKSGRRYVDATIYLPRFDASADVPLLVDTGADTSLLTPTGLKLFRLDYTGFEGAAECFGIGGVLECFVEPAWVMLSGDKTIYSFAVSLEIAKHRSDLVGIPSLLGRDVLDRVRLYYCSSEGLLTLEPLSPDDTFEF